jgi:diamine N-acetyltransferase
MLLRPATAADIPAIVAVERLPESRKYVGQWCEERHHAALASEDARYFVSEDASGAVQTYVILLGLAEPNRTIELKRVAVASPDEGLGRSVLTETLRIVFDELGAHRLFLDVVEDNPRARHLYESLGFVYEGTKRDGTLRDGKYYPLHLMSMLEEEYRARRN